MPLPPATGNFRVYPASLAQAITGAIWLGPRGSDGDLPGTGVAPTSTNVVDAIAFLKSGAGMATSNIPTDKAAQPGRAATYYCPAADQLLFPTAGNYLLYMVPDTAGIIFNPGVGQQVIDILSGDFPAGFLATNIKVNYFGILQALNGVSGITSFKMRFGGTTIHTINNLISGYGQSTSGASYSIASIASAGTAIVGTGVYFTAAATFNNFGYELDLAQTDAANAPLCIPAGTSRVVCLAYGFYLSGDYISTSWSATLVTDPVTGAAGDPETIITINNSEGRLGEINQCVGANSPFTAVFKDRNNVSQTVTIPCSAILERSATKIKFILRGYGLPWGGRRISLYAGVTGVQFTGTAFLLQLNVLLADGSGIYQITKDKLDDTYYDRTVPATPTTVAMKIRDPLIKTGFF